MTQPFADALTWVPKSRALGATLGRAHDLARAKGHAEVTLEHLLLALIEDPDASAVLLAAGVDLLALNQAASAYIEGQPGGTADLPTAAPALTAILEYAVAAARQSRRAEINGAIVLAAVVGEGKSEAARMLLASGLTFAHAVQALKRASTTRPVSPEPVGSDTAVPKAEPTPPPPLPPPPPASPPAPPEPASGAVTTEVPSPPAPRVPPPPAPARAADAPHADDEDPIATARRRIEAIRSGRSPPDLVRPGAITPEPASSAPAPAPDHATAAASWAPPPLPPAAAPAARPVRMPPPVPPLAEPKSRPSETTRPVPSSAAVPWSDGEPTAAVADAGQGAIALGNPIEPERLADRIPSRMVAKTGTTVEVRVSKGDVLATAAAIGGRSAVSGAAALARTLTVRLRAPSGGFHIESISLETQWLDLRSAQNEADEVRWRWLVTPHARGRKPLLLSCTLRTVAADGMIVETMLPDAEVTVLIADSLRAGLRTWLVAVTAFSAGAMLALLASGGWSALVTRLFG